MNVPDHIKLFDNVKDTLGEITPFIATISSKNCSNLKSMVEESIYQLINANSKVIFCGFIKMKEIVHKATSD